MTRPAAVVRIETLVVEGVTVTHSHRLGEEVRRALEDLLVARGLPARLSVTSGGDVEVVRTPPVRIGARPDVDALGQDIAGALYEGLDRG